MNLRLPPCEDGTLTAELPALKHPQQHHGIAFHCRHLYLIPLPNATLNAEKSKILSTGADTAPAFRSEYLSKRLLLAWRRRLVQLLELYTFVIFFCLLIFEIYFEYGFEFL